MVVVVWEHDSIVEPFSSAPLTLKMCIRDSMSGIIKDKWDMVRESAESAGFFLETHMIQGEWNACVFKKTKDISGVIGG